MVVNYHINVNKIYYSINKLPSYNIFISVVVEGGEIDKTYLFKPEEYKKNYFYFSRGIYQN